MFSYTKIMQGIQAVSAVVTDAYFNLVTLLLNTTTTNGAQNNTFLDSSTANSGSGWTITRNANTTQGTFTPFSQTGWGNYFDGSSALTLGSSADFILDANFTIEGFIYPTTSGVDRYICAYTDAGPVASWDCYLDTTNKLNFRWINTVPTAYTVTSVATIPSNSWTYFAVTLSGTTLTLYVNGSSVATTTVAGSARTGTRTFGIGQPGASTATRFSGYISNVRYVKGTALTISSTPTSALTPVTNTKVLTCQSNRFVDNSATPFTLTTVGSPSVQAFSPFAPTAAYSTTTVGGSGYFDGTGDYLQNPASASNGLGTGNYTLECWFYLNSAPASGSDRTFIRYHWTGSAGQNAVYYLSVINSAGTLYPYTFARDVTTPANNTTITSSTAIRLSTWNHVAAVRSGTTLTLYLNGVSVGSATGVSWNITAATNIPIYIGTYNGSSEMMDGYISGARVVKSAVYSGSTYTIPTAPPTSDVNTQLLLNYTNAGIYDAAAKNVLETVGNAQVSTTQAKFGTTSMSFDGTGDYLTLPASQNFNLSTGDFTIECWFYYSTTPPAGASYDYLWGLGGTGTTALGLYIQGGVPKIWNGSSILTTTGSISATTWYHIAVVRSSGTLTVYLNGTSIGSVSMTSNLSGGGSVGFNVARWINAADPEEFTGYIDDLRVTKYARYTANFTAPTAAFPTQ